MLVSKPSDPLSYLVDKLQEPKGKYQRLTNMLGCIIYESNLNCNGVMFAIVRRVFMFGLPGTRRADTAEFVAKRMGW